MDYHCRIHADEVVEIEDRGPEQRLTMNRYVISCPQCGTRTEENIDPPVENGIIFA